MSIKLKGSTDGSVTLQAPADTSPTGTDKTFTLPTADGTSGQVLQTNGSGAFSFANPGKFTSYAIICDEKTSSTDGGTFTSGSHQTRDLNTEIADPDGIVSISSNQFTLSAGTYLIRASAPAFKVDRHAIRLKNVTDDTTVQDGALAFCTTADSVQTNAILSARVTITSSKAFEIRHKCETSRSGNGFGIKSNAIANASIYTIVEIYKEA